MSQEFFTVSQINNFIKDVINAGFPQPLWICGEIQQYERNKSKKHIFFELIEKDPNSSEIIAKVGVVIFEKRKDYIESVLQKSENAFTLKDDIEIKFACRVDYYSPHGAVRLIVEDIDPVYTLGKLAQEKQKLIAELKKKGFLDKNKHLTLPQVPLNIGLITSYDSAAYNDFISELKKSRFAFKIFLRNALVQGKKAEEDIARALAEFKEIDLDIIVITRGGGSIADLSCFDSKLIAEAIAECQIPVLSGIGHEINMTITDLAAYTFAKTPTAIAQYIVSLVEDFLKNIDDSLRKIIERIINIIEGEKARLSNNAHVLQSDTLEYLKSHNADIIRIAEVLKNRPLAIFKEQVRSMESELERLLKVTKNRIHSENNKLQNCSKIINFASPKNTIKRGFSITRDKEGKVIRKVSDVSNGQDIKTEVLDGSIESKVIN